MYTKRCFIIHGCDINKEPHTLRYRSSGWQSKCHENIENEVEALKLYPKADVCLCSKIAFLDKTLGLHSLGDYDFRKDGLEYKTIYLDSAKTAQVWLDHNNNINIQSTLSVEQVLDQASTFYQSLSAITTAFASSTKIMTQAFQTLGEALSGQNNAENKSSKSNKSRGTRLR